jgi:hypothetical protein
MGLLIHVLEFTPSSNASELKVVRSTTYKLELSEQQREMIRQTVQKL